TTTARADMRASLLKVSGLALNEGTATVALADRRAEFVVCFTDPQGRTGVIAADAVVSPEQRSAALRDLTVTFGSRPWRLVRAATSPVVSWNENELSMGAMSFTGATPDEQISVSGTWRGDGRGALHVTATRVSLDALQGTSGAPARYGGVMNADAMIRGTRRNPIVTGRIDVTAGRVRRFAYERLTGRVDYAEGDFSIDVRLDQSPGVWITAVGTVPAGLFDRELPDRKIDVAITSSPI